MTVWGHRIIFLSASRFQFVALEPAKILDIGQEIMSLWQKIILNIYRVFAVAREIIYEHKISVHTIFLTRLEHSNFNTCKIFVKFYDDFSNNDRKPVGNISPVIQAEFILYFARNFASFYTPGDLKNTLASGRNPGVKQGQNM